MRKRGKKHENIKECRTEKLLNLERVLHGERLESISRERAVAVFQFPEGAYRVDLTLCKSISVIYNKEYGFYANVVVTENDNIIYVEL